MAVGATVGLATMTVASVATMQGAADRQQYMKRWRILEAAPSPRVEGMLPDADLGFNAFLWGLARVAPLSEPLLYGFVAAIVVGAYVIASRLLLPAWATLGALVTMLAMGLIVAYSSVAIRQGLAVGFLLAAVALYSTGRGRWPVLAGLVAVASVFHWSALPLGLAVLVLRVRTPGLRWPLLAWVALAVGYVQGWNVVLLERLGLYGAAVQTYSSDVAFDAYLGGAGARLDFLAVSAAILAAGLLGRRWMADDDDRHARVLTAYIVFNCAFLLVGFVAFGDRIAAYSWFLAPWLLWLPLTRVKDAMLPALVVGAVVAFGLVAGTLPQVASF